MKKTVYEMVTKEVKEKISELITCDECGAVIKDWKHYEVTTHHSDWGNDSIDSYENLDLCSKECLIKNMKEYFESSNGSEEYNIENNRMKNWIEEETK